MRPSVKTYLVDDAGTRAFGPGPAELLRRIREHGSLRAAAISMGMAYTKALGLIKNAEQALGHPLTTRVVGGAGGGGSTPTPEADALLRAYEEWTASVEASAAAQFSPLFAGVGTKVASQVPAEPGIRVGVGVMAAGHARRFGSNKLVEPLLGEPVALHALRAVPQGFPIAVASTTPEVDAICSELGIDVVRPDGSEQGHSVAALAAHAGRQGWDACIFLPADQPLVEPDSLRALARAGAAKPDHVVRLAWRGRVGSPALFAKSAFGRLEQLDADQGGSALVGQLARTSVEARWPWELWDVDVPADLVRVREILEAGFGRGRSV